MPQIPLDRIRATVTAALEAHGAAPWIAGHVADATTDSEARGNRICGLYYVESYCRQLQSGRVDGRAEPQVSRPKPATVTSDARHGFAQPAFARALPEATEATRANGIASLAVAHAHTCTSLGYFTRAIAREGLIGLGFTNASPIVAPPGGKTRVIGTNPIAFSVPDGQGGVAMGFDQSTTAVALGKITMAKAAGEAIPEGWAVDRAGRPTTDPAAALEGALVSAGGAKGWGFGVMAELLAAGMTGSTMSRDVPPLKAPDGPPHDLGQYYLLIEPASGFADTLTRLAEGVARDEGTRLPGQSPRWSDPVEVPDALWAAVQGLAT